MQDNSRLTFVITGVHPVSRDEIKAMIENKGHKVTDSVTTKTDYLVVGDKAGSKLSKAKKLGVPTIGYEDLLKLISNSNTR